ncbi:PLP-dependent aminotransferase family protein, partial [Arthrobacter sp.]|uniref:aminotransferase-like domain-containing protein n=1 Tax=Arthrobacter sp. TaxID=1667 RepID=UPI0028A232BC
VGRAARGGAAVDRVHPAGLPALRSWFAGELTRSRADAAPVSAEDVLITPGGQSALASVFRALAGPGDAVVMESPTYWGAIAAARQAGLRIVPVARGTRAPAASDLDEALAASGARIFYAQPHFANPTGTLWNSEERNAIADVMRARGAYLIEDDWARDFGIDADPAPLAGDDPNGHIVYIRSLTKSVSPAVRIAALVARGPAMARLQADRTVDDLYVSGLLQAAAAEVLSASGWDSHRSRLRTELRLRRDELAHQVSTHLGPDALTLLPKGGLNLWIQLPDGTDTAVLAAGCRSKGVLVAPGSDWFPTDPAGSFLRLNYAGAHPHQFGPALRVIASVLDAGVPGGAGLPIR